MATIHSARDRAEELLGSLQGIARELLEAEEGLVKTVRALVEERGLAPQEVKKKLEELVGRIKANKIWDRLRASDAVVALVDYRGEVERKVEESVQRLLGSLPVATRGDVQDLSKKVGALTKRLNELTKKFDA